MVAPWIKVGQRPRKKAPVGVQVPAPAVKKAEEPSAPVSLEVTPAPSVVEEVIEESIDLNKLRKAELIILAEERGLDTSGRTKSRLIELLNN
jgi:hypothetical protein